jgi:transposase
VKRVEEITEFSHLKQAAILLQKENERLHRRITELAAELSSLKGTPQQELMALELQKLREQLASLQHKQFGDSSEKQSRDKAAEADAASGPRTGHGPRQQGELPLAEQVHELPVDDRVCPACHGTLGEMTGQYEESEEVTVIERSFKLVRHKRKKYRCRCNGAVVTAPGPVKHLSGGRYSLEFAAEVAVGKYLDHLPLERQRKVMLRQGLVVTTQTLWDQIDALARLVEPCYQALRETVMRSAVIHADETWWRVMEQRSKRRWWTWSMASSQAVYYRIFRSRSAEAASQLLKGYQGVVVVDDYAAYRSAARAGPPGWTLCYCWAHVRRQFMEAQQFYPKECTEALGLIRELYAVEHRALDQKEGLSEVEYLELRLKLRREQSRDVVNRLREWGYSQRVMPESSLRKAVEYMLRLWTGLTRFLDDPRVPLDNNLVERALRGVVVGRKNHYGSHSLRGTQVAAVFYSLLETAKLVGTEPRGYLIAAARQAAGQAGSVLLPASLAS